METIHQAHMEETKKHGDILFPFTIYPCSIPKDFPAVPLHWHRNMEIIYIKKGALMGQLGMKIQSLAGGDICIVPPGTLHALRGMDGQEEAEYENIIFDAEMLGSGAADICSRQYLVPLAAGQLLEPFVLKEDMHGYSNVQACLEQAEQLCKDKTTGFEMGVKASMLQLIFQLLQLQPGSAAADQPDTARLKRMIDYIQREYAQPISVDQAAAAADCSASHFMRWFKDATGSSFVSYLNEYRLNEAARLLRSTDEKILSIANEVGFGTLSNFNHQFKEQYGITPTQYRKGKT